MSAEQKTPFAVSISNLLDTKLGQNQQAFGFQLPCRVTAVNGAIVTVNFEIDTGGLFTFPPVTCPIAESTYVRLPVQVGDFGVCMAADARLGGVTGLGQGLAPLELPFNLGALVYVPNGVVLRDTNSATTITLVPSGVTIIRGNTEMVINDTGVTITGNLLVHGTITGDNGFHISGGTGATMQITGNISQTGNFASTGTLTNNGKNVGSTHEHSGVQSGSSNTGVPI